MKKTILLFASLLIMIGANAQKIKQTEGKLSFLKGQKMIMVSFVFPDDMRVSKYTEKEYIKVKTEKADLKEPGSGEKWLKSWEADPAKHYQPKFIELFNEGMLKKGVTISEDYSTAKYNMIVKTEFIEPGYNVGVSRKNANINLVVSIVETANPDNKLAEFTIIKSPGKMVFGTDFDTGTRIGEAYAKAAKEFVAFLLKKKAY
jgi:hypothetical protein